MKKPANTPKVAVKSKDAIVNTVKDGKAIMKDNFIKKTIESKLNNEHENSTSQKAETEATQSVENTAYTTADTVYHKGKTLVQNTIKEHRVKLKEQEKEIPENPEPTPKTPDAEVKQPEINENAPKTKENYNTNNQPSPNQKPVEHPKVKTDEKLKVKTKEEYLKMQNKDTPQMVKTKENYIKQHTAEKQVLKNKESVNTKPLELAKTKSSQIVKTKSSETVITPIDARREYIKNKIKTKTEYENKRIEEYKNQQKQDSHSLPKTKERYIQQTKQIDNEIVEVKTTLPNSQNDVKPNVHSRKKEEVRINVRQKQQIEIKTKDNYLQAQGESKTNIIKSPYDRPVKTKEQTYSVASNTQSNNIKLKTRDKVSNKPKATVKSGNAYMNKSLKHGAKKAKQKAVKTQKEVSKKAVKETAKRTKDLAVKSAQAAKTLAIKTAKAVAVIGKAIASAVAKAAASFFAAFGWIGVAIVLVVLIVIIIIGAIAGSPFGIFISEEAAGGESIPISSIVNECNIELSEKLTEIEDNTPHDRIVMEGEQADWGLVLSIFSVKVSGANDETVEDVVIIDDAKKQKLKDVFWDMNVIDYWTQTVGEGEEEETVLYISIIPKTKEEMILEYGFNDGQKEALETLLENSDGFIGATQSLAISDSTATDVIDNISDTISEERKNVVKKACSLVGKLTYFWGGKSSAIGWDSEWGKMKLVTAEGSRSSGCMRPFGLDCSGFVTWSFHNAGFAESAIGHGTSTQVAKGTRIPLSSAQPGDLAFYNDISHVGIVGGKDSSGNILVIHCSAGANNVVITTGGFGFAVRPYCY